jgi:hypothetical protein
MEDRTSISEITEIKILEKPMRSNSFTVAISLCSHRKKTLVSMRVFFLFGNFWFGFFFGIFKGGGI